MTHFDPEKWNITDDDKILSMELSDILAQEKIAFEAKSIHPREDLVQMVHKESNIILDMGFYGEKSWKVYTVDKLIGWEQPIEVKTFDNLVQSTNYIKLLASKYS